MLPVIHFIDSAQGSPYFESMGRWLDPDRFRSTFLSIRRAGGLQKIALRYNFEAASLEVDSRRGMLLAMARLRALWQRRRGAVVHAHTFEAGLVAALARPTGARLVYTRHHLDPHFRMGRPLHRLADRLTAARASVVVTPAAAVREHLIAREHVSPSKIVVIHNGIEDEAVPRRSLLAGVVLAVARLHEEKGIDLLLRAAVVVRRRVPELSLRIAGVGPDEAKLRALASELGLSGCVEFLGFRRDVPQLLAEAAVFCLPSRSEALPVAVLEAMRAGTPVVATAVGGVPEQLSGGAGWLVPPTAEELARALTEALGDPLRAGRAAVAARKQFERGFTAARMVGSYAALYEKVAR